MALMKFLSIRELQQQGSGIKDILDGDGKIVITSNGKPIGLTVGVDEGTFEEVIEDWKKIRQLRHSHYIEKQLDESERIAAGPNAQWLNENEFWDETEALSSNEL